MTDLKPKMAESEKLKLLLRREKEPGDYGLTVDLRKLAKEDPDLFRQEIAPWLPDHVIADIGAGQ